MFTESGKEGSHKLADLAAIKIRDMIVSGELVSGEPLAEMKLADALGMSRTPIREAISQLEFEGILLSIPGRGAIVADMTIDDFMEINSIRIALEPLAAVASMNVIPRPVISRIKSRWEGFLHVLDVDGDLPTDELTEEDGRLHDMFTENCGNRRLKNILRVMQFQAKRYVFAHWDSKSFVRETVEQHLDIVNGLEQFDKEHVVRALEKHLEANNMFLHIYQ